MSLNIGFKKNKRAEWVDYLFTIVIIFAIGIVIIIGKVVMNEVDTQFNSSSDMPVEAREAASTLNSNYISLWDGLFATLFIGLFITMIISAYFIRSHPIFYIIMIVVLGIFSVLNLMFAEIYNEVMSTPELGTMAEQFTKTSWFMGTLFPFFMVGFGILLGIVMYAKGGNDGM